MSAAVGSFRRSREGYITFAARILELSADSGVHNQTDLTCNVVRLALENVFKNELKTKRKKKSNG